MIIRGFILFCLVFMSCKSHPSLLYNSNSSVSNEMFLKLDSNNYEFEMKIRNLGGYETIFGKYSINGRKLILADFPARCEWIEDVASEDIIIELYWEGRFGKELEITINDKKYHSDSIGRIYLKQFDDSIVNFKIPLFKDGSCKVEKSNIYRVYLDDEMGYIPKYKITKKGLKADGQLIWIPVE